MSSKLERIITENEYQFDDWIDKINRYRDCVFASYRGLSFTNDEQVDITYELVEVFGKLFELCSKYGGFKDSFDHSKFHLFYFGLQTLIVSQKMGCRFELGIYEKGIFLSCGLMYPENLKNMDDGFWKDVIELTEYKGFELEENEILGGDVISKHPELFYNYKGVVFRIFRKYFFDVTEYNEVNSIGDFKITWWTETTFDDIVRQCCTAFKLMYKLNYSLWKIHDLREKKTNKTKG